MRLSSSSLAGLWRFESAVRLSSFKQAAIELHVTHEAVSQQIEHFRQQHCGFADSLRGL
jgi:DNA-binding transcriptional LysR family regulator